MDSLLDENFQNICGSLPYKFLVNESRVLSKSFDRFESYTSTVSSIMHEGGLI